MSTILKALKKSEAERAGTLDAPSLEPASEPGSGRWGLLAIIAPLVLITAVAGWVLARSDSPEAPATADAEVSSPAAAPAPEAVPAEEPRTAPPETAAVERSADAPADRPASGALNPRLPTAMSGPPVMSGPVAQMQAPPAADTPVEPVVEPVVIDPAVIAARARAQLEAEPPRLSTAPATLPTGRPAPATAAEPTPEPTPAKVADAGASPRPVEVATAQRPPATREPPARRERRPPAEDLPTIYALPAGTARTRFEELKLNMHVYAEDPADRFVLVNLRRHVEGDDLGSGLVIDGIRPEGVVVRADGTRWLWTPR